MLSRVADSLYWLSRYIERAEHTARLIAVKLDSMVEQTPEDAAALADELERVFAQLDPLGRRVLELRLQGLKIAAIADDTGRSERSVRRALAQIRDLLAERRDDD